MKWYENKYRRHLCDMHIDDWNEEFLSEFSAESYFENIKKANVQAVMIYLQSHIGLCYYPTAVGHMHKAFTGRENEMKRLVDMCRAEGISVIGYYSWIYNSVEHDAHPDWRLVDRDGNSARDNGSRYGHCCPNNPDYHRFVLEQIKEMSEYFTLDGMFYDMPFWPQPCYCEHCRRYWKEKHGGDIPNEESKLWGVFRQTFCDRLGELSLELSRYTRQVFGDISVELNYAFAALPAGNVLISTKTNDACDYIGGDIADSRLTHSFACKYFYSATHNQPFEYMPSRCNPNLAAHTVTRSRDRLLLDILLTTAHHGASLIIDAIDPKGTMDSRFYDMLGELFSQSAVYEPYMTGTLLEDVGVYYHSGAKVNPTGQNFNNYTGSQGAVRAFTEAHIPVGIIPSENRKELSHYKAIVLSEPANMTTDTVSELADYVSNGGTLYFSGSCQENLTDILLGGKVEKYTEHTRTYVGAKPEILSVFSDYNCDYPLPINASVPLVSGIEEEYVKATVVLPYTKQNERRCASIHSNPPGIKTDYPALVIKPYGSGTVIWSAAPIESMPQSDHREILVNLIKHYSKPSSLESDASSAIELVTFTDKDSTYISAVSLQEGDAVFAQPPFKVKLCKNREIEGVYLLPDRVAVDFTDGGAFVAFEARQLKIFDMYEIKFK